MKACLKKSENFFLSGKPDKALSFIEKVLDSSPDHVRALGLKGKILRSQGEKALAINFQKKALEQDPQNISLLFDLATTYAQAGQIDDEISLLKKIHRDNPKAIQPLVQLRGRFSKTRGLEKYFGSAGQDSSSNQGQ